ncbi:MAG: aminoglycoside phosphotransferase family protein [Saprospiraceae bacterium]|nr:aminoglycoside phosphotransferase family protein [Saprospiraceae bacterium]MCF8252676.1 aminoglycoside phosphotransferase family protein [Saprospiraceae bacterium]MCF8282875.1 aminoglycoside phosphotransferase family protein [Bacteroidales bacterium]MCF8314248.1 aminoglycoside phosphotransferase family protein [Saprospiraceae bacterium]MCF8443064.1 aminoglycoside phosphotransferase family protein [Saprospiraceae bacterium]
MQSIIQQFFDYQQLISLSPFGTGHINDTYRLEIVEAGKPHTWLLQRLNHNVFRQPEAVMQNIHLVAEHLAAQPYLLKILAPKPTRSGHWLHHDEAGNYWRVFPFFENTETYERVETEAQAHEAARAFGAFAKALNSLDASQLHPTIPGFHDGEKRLADFLTALENAVPERLAEAQPEVDIILHNQLIFKKIADLNLPQRAIHHDTKINNLLFDASTHRAAPTPVGVIDLDTVMPGIILSDFGDLVRTSVSLADEDEADLTKIQFRKPIYDALLEGFLSEMGGLLTPAEYSALPLAGPWLTLMQAVRFIGDFLVGDTYYKVKYPKHNLVRGRNQLALFEGT